MKLASYEAFNTAVQDFDDTVAGLIDSAIAAETTVSTLQAQKAALLTTGDVAGAVVLSVQIKGAQEEVSTNRESAELMKASKWSTFVNTIDGVATERDQVVADALTQFNTKLAEVMAAKEAYLTALAALGTIKKIAKNADDELKTVAYAISKFKGEPHRMQSYSIAVHWDAPTLYHTLKRDDGSSIGIIALTEKDQMRAFTNEV